METDKAREQDARLLGFRKEYPILERSNYLINNSLGAMPRAACGALELYADEWAEKGVVAWHEDWLHAVEKHSHLLARALGAPSGSVMLHPNVSVAMAVIASALDFSGPRRQVVLSELEFHTVAYVWKAWQKYGAEIVVVPAEKGLTIPTERMMDAINEKTLVVPMSHVIYRTSYRQDAAAIAEAARRKGAMVVLDVYQSIGSMPLAVEKWGVDFAVGGSVKWICGGPGVGYLYVRPDLKTKFKPAVTGWFSHKDPFAFDLNHEYTDSMWRYATGTPDIPAVYAAGPGLELVLDAGLENIRERSLRLTRRLMEGALARGWRVNTPQDDAVRGGHVTLEMPEAESVSRELIRRRVIVDYRPPGRQGQRGGVRFSPHFYNTEAEVDAALEEIAKILKG